VLDTTSSLATLHRSEDGGRSWIPVTLPSGGVNYNNVPFSPTGLMVEDGTIHAVLTSSQRLSSPDGIAWTLLPATTNVSFPWPVKLPAGSAIWATAATNGQQWQVVQTPPVANIPLTQPIFATTPPPQYFRGRFIQLSSAGVRTTPLANLTLSFPDQAGHTAKAGETFPVDVEIRNTGFDNAWLDIPVKIELRVEGNEASAGSIELGTSIAIGEALRKTVQVTVPANTGGGRYHIIASLVEDGGLPVDHPCRWRPRAADSSCCSIRAVGFSRWEAPRALPAGSRPWCVPCRIKASVSLAGAIPPRGIVRSSPWIRQRAHK
jgi:hypothetical protein